MYLGHKKEIWGDCLRGMKLRFLVIGIILIVLSLALFFGRGMNHAVLAITGVGVILLILGLIMR